MENQSNSPLVCIRRPRTIHEYLNNKVAGPAKANDLPPGVVRLSDLIEDFFKQHTQ
ncbi:hypothetical protein D9M69_717580 [compost metagenome]